VQLIRSALLEANRLYHRRLRGKRGIKVIDADWDNLLILDACQYDLFADSDYPDGKLRSVVSGGSSTSDFLQYNFDGRNATDTVYVSANPQIERHGVDEQVFKCVKLWTDRWDDDLRTVRPEDVTDAAIAAQEDHPSKRLIVHYIQPHYPFIGETGRQIEHGTVTGDGVIATERSVASVWDKLANGDIAEATVRTAYRENLDLTLPEVDRLLNNLVGKSVVTSDHGNSFGTLGVYGHPGGVYLDDLVRVPWLEIESSTRKRISEAEQRSVTDNSPEISERLADLGYA